jgi:hypothetical protein
MSPERLALIAEFRKSVEGIEQTFEARSHRGDWVMPYRFFRPQASGTVPLVVYLHGSGGQGTDNLKSMGLGNVFGSRLCALPENQRRFPCYVVVPQTDRAIRYGPPAPGDSGSPVVPGGDGARLALSHRRDPPRVPDRPAPRLPHRSTMGGRHLLAQRPNLWRQRHPLRQP